MECAAYTRCNWNWQLDQVKDENLVVRSTLERRTMYKSMRMAEPRYADSVVGSPD